MMMEPDVERFGVELAITAADEVGDGPVWDAAAERLLWTDHQRRLVHVARRDAGGAWREADRIALDRPVSCALPRASGGILVAGGNEILLMSDSGDDVRTFARLGFDPAAERFNDVKCDSRGRLWAGTLTTDFSAGAALYRIDADGSASARIEGARLTNGFDWSPDDRSFYFVDSLTLLVERFDFDPDAGALSNRRTLVALDPADGLANGLTVDAQGDIWVALTCGGAIRRFTPDGVPTAHVALPIPGVTSCAFGGPDLGDMFITSRRGRVPEIIRTFGVSEAKMESWDAEAGGLFICRPGRHGRAPHPVPY